MSHSINTAGTVAVANEYYWEPIATCPRGVKVQLLGLGGIAIYATYDGKTSFWTHWAPLPRKRVGEISDSDPR